MSGFFLQNATVLLQTQQLLQNAIVITKRDSFIANCNSCYKMRRLLQIAIVHLIMNNFFTNIFHVLCDNYFTNIFHVVLRKDAMYSL